MCNDLLPTKISKNESNKKNNNTGHKIYVRHIPLAVNSVHRLNIKYILKLLNTNPWPEKKSRKEIEGY